VIAWRWDDTQGFDVPMFRGIVGQSEDQIADAHVVTFTCHDYAAMLGRRFNQAAIAITSADQDDIVNTLLTAATSGQTHGTGNTPFGAASYLPLARMLCNPDGTTRGLSATLRQRNYNAQTAMLQAVGDLAAVQGGFDFDVLPIGMPDHQTDALRVFYPSQGVTRSSPVLNYGGTVAAVTRTIASDDYANYVRYVGNNVWGDYANADASGTTVGEWARPENASDVTIAATLVEQAAGEVMYLGVLTPAYTVTLRPGVYYAGLFNMGDTLPLVIKSGRLNIPGTPARVISLTFDIGDDGNEDVAVGLGRPVKPLTALIGRNATDIDALARR
jgi:hypothetical protein